MVDSKNATERVETVDELRAILTLENSKNILLALDVDSVPRVVELLLSETSSSHGSSHYRKLCLKSLRLLVRKHHILPRSLFLDNIAREGSNPSTGGGFADIWKGILGEKTVCLKVMRIYLEASEKRRKKVLKAFCEEALVWKQLNHPNILPLLGVNTELFSPAFCLVSPWMSNGDLITYLEENPEHDRLRSIYEIASGLAYLHSLEPMIIHGDIKGANILIDEQCSCQLADFGLAGIKESQRLDSTTSSTPRGTFRWMAPEIFQGADSNERDHSPKDVYAYACTIFEVMSGTPPFTGVTDAAVMFKVISGVRPSRPIDGWCPDVIWDLVEKCWLQDPAKRPRAEQVEQELGRMILNEGPISLSRIGTELIKPAQAGPQEIKPDSSLERLSDVMETTLPPLLGVTAPRIQVQEGTSHTTISTGTLKRYTKDGRVILFNVQTLYDYEATDDSEMSFHAGDIIAVTATPNNGWWHGELLNDERRQPGRDVFPSNHVLSDGRLFVTARYDYEASDIHDMSFKAGDIIAFTVTPEDGWWLGELLNEERRQPGKYFPSNFVESPDRRRIVRALHPYEANRDDDFSFEAGDLIAVDDTHEDGWSTGELFDWRKSSLPGRKKFRSASVAPLS